MVQYHGTLRGAVTFIGYDVVKPTKTNEGKVTLDVPVERQIGEAFLFDFGTNRAGKGNGEP